MLLQLLPQFFSPQHLSVNLSLSFVGTVLLVNRLCIVNVTLVQSPVMSVQGGKVRPSPKFLPSSAEARYPVSQPRQTFECIF